MSKLLRTVARGIQRRANGLRAATRQVDALTAGIRATVCDLARQKRDAAAEAMERARILTQGAAKGVEELKLAAHAEHLRFGEQLAAAIAASNEAPLFTADDTDFALLYVAQRAATATAHALSLLTAAYEVAEAEYRDALAKTEIGG